jgi:hypothetical protein
MKGHPPAATRYSAVFLDQPSEIRPSGFVQWLNEDSELYGPHTPMMLTTLATAAVAVSYVMPGIAQYAGCDVVSTLLRTHTTCTANNTCKFADPCLNHFVGMASVSEQKSRRALSLIR